jgi:hypothetical protein
LQPERQAVADQSGKVVGRLCQSYSFLVYLSHISGFILGIR